jgi:hypothetical protein
VPRCDSKRRTLLLGWRSSLSSGEDQQLYTLGLVLSEQLGEEYPDTLGSIITAEGAIANVVGMTQMNPPVKDLLPRMTPILRNRHKKVQEASINLIGRIGECLHFNCFGHRINNRSLLTANRSMEFVPAGEQMSICSPNEFSSTRATESNIQHRSYCHRCRNVWSIPTILNEYRTAR